MTTQDYKAKAIEKKWQRIWDQQGVFSVGTDLSKKNSMFLKCFHTPLVTFTWVIYAIIQ
jgi:leucyl-tRNA synthetase